MGTVVPRRAFGERTGACGLFFGGITERLVEAFPKASGESVAEVGVGEFASGFEAAIGMLEDDGWVWHAVEGGGFDHGVVGHVIEDQDVTDFQGAWEGVVTRDVAG